MAKRPDLIATDTQITHSQKKLTNVQGTIDQILQDENKIKLELQSTQAELVDVTSAANEAQGMVVQI